MGSPRGGRATSGSLFSRVVNSLSRSWEIHIQKALEATFEELLEARRLILLEDGVWLGHEIDESSKSGVSNGCFDRL